MLLIFTGCFIETGVFGHQLERNEKSPKCAPFRVFIIVCIFTLKLFDSRNVPKTCAFSESYNFRMKYQVHLQMGLVAGRNDECKSFN